VADLASYPLLIISSQYLPSLEAAAFPLKAGAK